MSGSPFRSPWSFNLAPQDTTWLAGWPAGSCSGEQVLMVSGESPHAVPACLSLQGLWKLAGALAQGGSAFALLWQLLGSQMSMWEALPGPHRAWHLVGTVEASCSGLIQDGATLRCQVPYAPRLPWD